MAITNGYVDLNTLKAAAGDIDTDDTTEDAALEMAIEAASRMVDAFTNRRFWQDGSVVVRYYTYRSPFGRRYVDSYEMPTLYLPDDISTSTGLVVATDGDDDGTYEDTWTLDDDFTLGPANAAADSEPWTAIAEMSNGEFSFPTNPRGIKITAKFGWAAVPTAVEQATLLQANRLYKRRHSPFGVTGSPAEGAGEMRLLSKLDPDVEALVRRYRRVVFA